MRKVRRMALTAAVAAVAIWLAFTTMAAPATFQGYPVIGLTLNGKPVVSDVPAVNFHGRTVVPLRALADLLGLAVEFDAATNMVHLRSPLTGGEAADGDASRVARLERAASALQQERDAALARVRVLEAQVAATAAPPAATPVPLVADVTRARVVRAIDGDTIEVAWLGGPPLPSNRVRFIGVDTPESTTTVEPFGKEAAAFTNDRLVNRSVWLTKDVSDTDRYNRSLRFVWTTEPPPEPTEADMRQGLFNALLLLEGFANILTYPPDVRFAGVFQAFERAARDASRGLWAAQSAAAQAPAASTAPLLPALPPTTVTPVPAVSDAPALRYDPSGPDRDCGDFATQAEAQAFFIAAGGPARDPHRLDSDKNGLACESLR